MKIIGLKYGESVYGENHILEGGRRNIKLPISFVFYLIQTGEKNILIDSGCDYCLGFEIEPFRRPIELLRDCGLSPLDITDLVLTHAHFDHIALACEYKNATVYIQADEYEKGKKYISTDAKVVIYEEWCSICEGVTAVKIGGHSIGSSIVKVKSGETEYVIVGDECYAELCIAKQIPTGASRCPEKSRRFVEDYRNEQLLFCHDGGILPGNVGSLIIST